MIPIKTTVTGRYAQGAFAASLLAAAVQVLVEIDIDVRNMRHSQDLLMYACLNSGAGAVCAKYRAAMYCTRESRNDGVYVASAGAENAA
jgi:hypothetical protein